LFVVLFKLSIYLVIHSLKLSLCAVSQLVNESSFEGVARDPRPWPTRKSVTVCKLKRV